MSVHQYNSEFKASQNQNKHTDIEDDLVLLSSKSISCYNLEKNYIAQFKVDILTEIDKISKLIECLKNKIKKLEKSSDIKELASKLNKHYEQSRRCK